MCMWGGEPVIWSSASHTLSGTRITGGLAKLKCLGSTPQVSESVVLEQGPGIYIFSKFPGDVDTVGPGTILRRPGSHTLSAFSVVFKHTFFCCCCLVRVASLIWAMILHCFPP